MKYLQGKWTKEESTNTWVLFLEESILNNGKAMKWFYKSTLDPSNRDQKIFGSSSLWGHLCPLRGEDCICWEINPERDFDAMVSKKIMKDFTISSSDNFYHAYIIKGSNLQEIDLSFNEKSKLSLALEKLEKNFMICDCGSKKLKLPHSHWCSLESYRRGTDV